MEKTKEALKEFIEKRKKEAEKIKEVKRLLEELRRRTLHS